MTSDLLQCLKGVTMILIYLMLIMSKYYIRLCVHVSRGTELIELFVIWPRIWYSLS